jgi:dTDP-4-dehydrorhamnose 3,5-epimerase
MLFHETTLKDAWLIDIEPRGDSRGFFARIMCVDEFSAHGMEATFVQQNMSFSAQRGTLRGMHYQIEPHAEVKLVRCVRGALCDVIVDVRQDSPSYLKYEAFELSAENHRQLYVPRGFAHGFVTLTDDVEASYLVSAPYASTAERGLRYDDPRLGIVWPIEPVVISDKDRNWPLIDERPPPLF